MKKNSFAKVLLASTLLTSGVYAFSVENVHATTQQQNNSIGTIEKINDSTARFNLKSNIKYTVDKNGVATLTDTTNNKTETLPSVSKDKDGNNITLVYFEEKGKLGVYAQSQQEERGAIKCAAGIAGGAITGAGTVGLGGAAVGTVTLPVVGTVSGGLVGAVTGGVGGGLTGGATFCGSDK